MTPNVVQYTESSRKVKAGHVLISRVLAESISKVQLSALLDQATMLRVCFEYLLKSKDEPERFTGLIPVYIDGDNEELMGRLKTLPYVLYATREQITKNTLAVFCAGNIGSKEQYSKMYHLLCDYLVNTGGIKRQAIVGRSGIQLAVCRGGQCYFNPEAESFTDPDTLMAAQRPTMTNGTTNDVRASVFGRLSATPATADQHPGNQTVIPKTTAEMLNSVGQEKQRSIVDTPITRLYENQHAAGLWTFSMDKKSEKWALSGIYRDGLLAALNEMGYYKRFRPDGRSHFFLHSANSIIEETVTARMLDQVKEHIRKERIPMPYKSTFEARSEILKKQAHLLFNTSFLQALETHEKPVLRDTAKSCYLFYRNGVVEITGHSVNLIPYSEIGNYCVWSGQLIQRDFIADGSKDCHFRTFHHNISNDEPARIKAVQTATGYLIHNYNNPADGQAVVCYDEELTDRRTPQGGTGKGVFAKGIQQVRPVAAIDGKKFDPNDRFCFQEVKQETAVLWIDDPKRDFTLERFFSILTEGLTVEGKGQSAYKIPAKESPKVLVSTNTILANEGTSNIRRQFVIEFSDYYKKLIKAGEKSNPIIEVHGCVFFSEDWNTEEWHCFDRYMVECVHLYLRDGQTPYKTHNVAANRLKQLTGDDFFDWVMTYNDGGKLQPDIEYQTADLFNDFRTRYSVDDLKQRGFTERLKKYAESQGLTFKVSPDKKIPKFRLLPK